MSEYTPLPTNLVDDELALSQNGKRTYNIVDSEGNVVATNVHFVDTSTYTTVGSNYGAEQINEQNERINSLTGISVSVHSDGAKTYGQLLNDLFALIDATKVTRLCQFFTRNNNILEVIPVKRISSTELRFNTSYHTSTTLVNSEIDINANNSIVYDSETTATTHSIVNYTSQVIAVGSEFGIFY